MSQALHVLHSLRSKGNPRIRDPRVRVVCGRIFSIVGVSSSAFSIVDPIPIPMRHVDDSHGVLCGGAGGVGAAQVPRNPFVAFREAAARVIYETVCEADVPMAGTGVFSSVCLAG